MMQCHEDKQAVPPALSNKAVLWRSSLLLIGFWALSLSSGCASGKVTQDLSEGADTAYKWELITVQSDFIGKSDFLALTEIDGQELEHPLVFGLDVVLLGPGEHRLKLKLGTFENYNQLAELDASYAGWKAEIGDISLKEPTSPKGRNYLVASYDKIYTSNTKFSEYMQRWVVSYPRTIDADKTWKIESLDPQTKDLTAAETEPEESDSE